MANKLFLGLLLILLMVIALLGGAWFMQNFERHSEEIRSGFSVAARRNPWLAAERYLQRLGLRVEAVTGREYLRTPPAQAGVLLVRELGPDQPEARQRELLAWVAAGSHLVITPQVSSLSDESVHGLLQTLGVSVLEREPAADAGPVEMRLTGSTEPLRIDFERSRSLQFEGEVAVWRARAEIGYHLLRLPYGDGAITLLSDNDFLSNDAIDAHDHALLLANLVDGNTRVWMLYNTQMPSLPRLLWKRVPHLMLSGAVVLLVWLWWLSRRSGPLLVVAEAPRRDLLEHLQAAAEFFWKHDRARDLQRRTRRQVEGRWLRAHPQLKALHESDRCAWLASRTGLASDAVHQALYAEHDEERMLIRSSTVLQRLLAALHAEKTRE
jgi:hypothetical protein